MMLLHAKTIKFRYKNKTLPFNLIEYDDAEMTTDSYIPMVSEKLPYF